MTARGVRVVHAEKRDVHAIRGLLLSAAFDLYRVSTAAEHLVDWLDASTSELVLAERFDDASVYIAAAVDRNRRMVGTGYINAVGYIGGLAAARHRQGIGAAVLDHLLQQPSRSEPWMSVWSNNAPMLELARSRGFEVMADDTVRYLTELRFLILHRPDRAGATALRPPGEMLRAAA